MQMTAMIQDMPLEAKRRFLHLIPMFTQLLDGTTDEFNRRFVGLMASILPVLKNSDLSTEQNMLDLLRWASTCAATDQRLLVDLAVRLSPEESG
jgi:hypothetical protein